VIALGIHVLPYVSGFTAFTRGQSISTDFGYQIAFPLRPIGGGIAMVSVDFG
jgi:hypothetical protein